MDERRGGVINLILLAFTLVFAWRGFDFYRNNSGGIFLDDLSEGLAATLSAGWAHPAFGICCLVPMLTVIVNLPYILDRYDNTSSE